MPIFLLILTQIYLNLITVVLAESNKSDIFVIYDPVSFDNETFEFNTKLFEKLPSECGKRNGYYLSRIVGGKESEQGEFPWLVSLQIRHKKAFKHLCGGAILNQYWIVSAAHCVYDIDIPDLSVVVGEHHLYEPEGFEQHIRVKEVKLNHFDMNSFLNDISLLKLQRPMKFGEFVGPICLPQSSDKFDETAIVAGWGRLGENDQASKTVQYLSVPILDRKICDVPYKKIGYSGFLNECQICAGYLGGGKDACQGDSGGPLFCRKDDSYYLCGIVSWGYGCARKSFPGMYTKVTCFVDWIKETITEN